MACMALLFSNTTHVARMRSVIVLWTAEQPKLEFSTTDQYLLVTPQWEGYGVRAEW